MKLELKDITIKTPGVQIKEKILRKYGSIKRFAEEIDLYESSIIQYLSNKNLGSSTFKIRTMAAFEVDFSDMYMSDEEQVRYMASTISVHIDEYNLKEDIKIFDKLKEITIENDLYEDYAIVCRAYAYYFYEQGAMDRARAYIEVATNYMRGREHIDRFGLYLSDFILMKYGDLTRYQLRRLINEFYETFENVKGMLTKVEMLLNLGEVMIKDGKLKESRELHKRALSIAGESKSISKCYKRLGDISELEGAHRKAEEFYKASFEYSPDDSDEKYDAKAAIARLCFQRGEMDRADRYIDDIYIGFKGDILKYRDLHLDIFFNIKIALKKYGEIENVIMIVLRNIKKGYIYNENHLKSIKNVVSHPDYKIEALQDLKNGIIKLYYEDKDLEEYQESIRSIVGGICINISKNEFLRRV